MENHSHETKNELSPDAALKLLLEGNRRFVENLRINRDLLREVKATANRQSPFAMILSCIDSRLSSELIFDLGIGDVYNARIAGNIINSDIIGSMEFACKLGGAKLIMVLGHSNCGAVKGACADAKLGMLTGLLEKIKPAIEKVESRGDVSGNNTESYFNEVARVNVLHTAAQITNESDVLSEMVVKDEIQIVCAMYDVKTGAVQLL